MVDVDFKSCFDTIPHDLLLDRMRAKVADGRVLALAEEFLRVGVLEDAALWTPEAGAPQGAVIIPLLSNIYLDSLDRLAEARGLEMTRYADDLVVLCRSREEADRALATVQEWDAAAESTAQAVGAARSRQRLGSSSLAERVLCGAWALQSVKSSRAVPTVLIKVNH